MNHLQTPEYKELRDLILKSEGTNNLDWHIDKPISLDRLLLCLQNKYFYRIEPNQGFEKAMIKLVKSSDEFVCDWTLGSPLHLQPLETIKKLLNNL